MRLRRNWALCAILAVALVVRVACVLQARGSPIHDVLLIDSAFYDRSAREVVSGAWAGGRVFFMNPFYTFFLAGVYATLGQSVAVVGLIQSVMGTASCWLVYVLGRHAYGRATGLVAAAMAAAYGVLAFYDGALLTASPILLMNLVGLVLLYRWTERPHTGYLVGAGAVLGLSATARPLVLLLVAALPLWFRLQQGGWRSGGRATAWTLLGAALVLGPLSVRNTLVGGELALTTSGAGMNFYVGNNAGATGIYESAPFLSSAEPEKERDDFLREAERRSGRRMTPGEASSFWLGEGLRFVREQPAAYLRLVGRKLFMFWNRVESQNNLSFYFAADFVPLLGLLPVHWGVAAPLGLVGLLFYRRREALLLDLCLAAYLAGCLLFFVSSEYRLPVVPVLLLYAGQTLTCSAAAVRGGRWRSLVLPAAVALVLAVPVHHEDAVTTRLQAKRIDYYNFGALYERRGELREAERMYTVSLRIDPDFATAHRALAGAYRKQGRLEEARAAEARALRLGGGEGGSGDDSGVREALEAYSRGDFGEAAKRFRQAIARGDSAAGHFNNLGLCYYRLGRHAEALSAFHRATAAEPAYGRARYNAALAQLALGDLDGAERSLRRVLAQNPRHVNALRRMAEVYAKSGRMTEARELVARVDSLVGR